MRTLLSLISVVIALTTFSSAEAEATKPEVRVSIQIAGKDGLDAIVRSYLTRELRKIDEIVLAEENPFYRINIIALRTYNVQNTHTGYTLSIVVTSMAPSQIINNLAASHKDANMTSVSQIMNNQGVLVDHFLQTLGPSDKELESVCGQIAAQFDGKQIDAARQMFQILKDRQNQAPIKK